MFTWLSKDDITYTPSNMLGTAMHIFPAICILLAAQ